MKPLIATLVVGVFVNAPIDTLPPKKKTDNKMPVYAIYTDRRIVIWKRVADNKSNKRDRRNPYFPTNTHLEPVYLN